MEQFKKIHSKVISFSGQNPFDPFNKPARHDFRQGKVSMEKSGVNNSSQRTTLINNLEIKIGPPKRWQESFHAEAVTGKHRSKAVNY